MRFTELMSTSDVVDKLRLLILEKHKVGGTHGLQLYLGESCVAALWRRDDFKHQRP